MKKRMMLSTILAVTLAATPFVAFAMEQKADQPAAPSEKKLSGDAIRFLTSLGLEVGGGFLKIIGLEGLGKGVKNLIATLNKLGKEVEKEELNIRSAKEILKLLAKTQDQSKPIKKDMKKLANWLSRPLKLLSIFVPRKVKKRPIIVRVEDEKGNIVKKTITVGEYLKNAPQYLVEISSRLTDRWQKIVGSLVGKLIKRIEQMEQLEAELKGIDGTPTKKKQDVFVKEEKEEAILYQRPGSVKEETPEFFEEKTKEEEEEEFDFEKFDQ